MALLDDIQQFRKVRYRETKADIVDYYQEKGWSFAKLARDLSPFTTDKNGNPYKPRNLERRFNPDRLDKPAHSWKDKAEYALFGATLPPIDEGFRPFDVHFKGKIKISRKWEKREFTVHVAPNGISFGSYTSPPEDAIQFMKDGWEGWLFLAYFQGDELAEDFDGTFTIL